MKKSLFALCCVLLLSLTMLTACQSAEEESSAPSSSAAGETSAAEESSEATPEPEATVTPNPNPANMNLLTGLPTLTDEAIGKRPVAVMINNVDASLPQYGISAADVIFEIPVEYDLTRLMALYGDYTQVPEVCSIRSCRYYYPILASGFDAVYVHWGMDETFARSVVNELGIDRVDALEAHYGLLGRDQDRLNSGFALEHTGMFYGPKLPEALESNGVRTDLKEDMQGAAFLFAPEDAEVIPEGEDANTVRVDFGANFSTFMYDAESGEYLKTYQNSPHMDARTNEQLSFENVVVLTTEISTLDELGHKSVDWQGGEDSVGYYISNGTAQSVTWAKADAYSPIQLFDKSGKEIEINRGKTYIAFTYAGNCTIS